MAKVTDYPRQTEVFTMPDGTSRERNTIWGKSTWDKPTKGVAFPDLYVEADTGKLFYFDDELRDWSPVG